MNTDTFIIFIMLALIVLGLAIGLFQSKKRGEILTLEAEKRGGEFSKSSLFGRQELRLPFKGNTVLIYSVPGSRYSPPRTYATLKSDTINLPAIGIAPNSVSQKLIGAFGKERYLTNDEEFDKKIVVRGDDPFALQRLLGTDVKQKLTDGSLRNLEVKFKPHEFQFTIQAIPSNEDGYDNFIDTALLLLQKVM